MLDLRAVLGLLAEIRAHLVGSQLKNILKTIGIGEPSRMFATLS
jgi:hypothetical protein